MENCHMQCNSIKGVNLCMYVSMHVCTYTMMYYGKLCVCVCGIWFNELVSVRSSKVFKLFEIEIIELLLSH